MDKDISMKRIACASPVIVLKLIGDVTLQNISSQSVNREQRWNVIKFARSWPFYFSRIFMAAVSHHLKNIAHIHILWYTVIVSTNFDRVPRGFIPKFSDNCHHYKYD